MPVDCPEGGGGGGNVEVSSWSVHNRDVLKGQFHVSAHGQTVTSAQLIPLFLKQPKAMMQEKETMS